MTRFLPPEASAHAASIDWVLTLVHILMGILFAGWALYFVWTLIRFRQSRHPHAVYQGARGRIALGTEIAVVLAEAMILVVIAMPVWFARTAAGSAPTAALVIRVVAEQFAWNVHYPGADGEFGVTSPALVSADNPIGLDRTSPGGADDLVLINQIHLPLGRPVIIQLSTKDVIHSFGVPAMRVKQDVIPGVFQTVWFTPILAGRFDVACSQLCGLAHYRMRAVVTVESDEAFRQFLAEQAALPR